MLSVKFLLGLQSGIYLKKSIVLVLHYNTASGSKTDRFLLERDSSHAN